MHILFTVSDRLRTTNNLLGDLYATVFVEKFSQEELKMMDARARSSIETNNCDVIINGNAPLIKPVENGNGAANHFIV